MFDIEKFCKDYGIDVHYPGEKNVTHGWLNIKCPFCFHDSSWHLGMNLQSGVFSCWKCGHKSGPEKVVHHLLGGPYNQAVLLVNQYQTQSVDSVVDTRSLRKLQLPEGIVKGLNKAATRYLRGRGFNPDYLVNEYHLMVAEPYTRFAGYIIIPIFQNYTMVNYVARSYVNSQNRYILCPNNQCQVPRNKLLYHFDYVCKSAIVVEGPTDVWALGRGSFATFGTRFSKDQLVLISKKELNELYIVYDNDAYDRAKDLAIQVSGLISHVEIIILDDGDPAEQDIHTIHELQKLIR